MRTIFRSGVVDAVLLALSLDLSAEKRLQHACQPLRVREGSLARGRFAALIAPSGRDDS